MDESDDLRPLLRAVSGPAPSPDAAARIAERAWSRADELRRAEAAAPRPVRLARAWSAVAAAAVVVAAAGFALRTSTPAFAVEGDPVQVLRNGSWASARRVEAGTWVFSPGGTRTIVGEDGGRIAPRPGSVFRVTRDAAAPQRFRVEIRAGEADVTGGTFVLSVGDDVEVKGAPGAESLAVFVSVGDGPDVAPPDDPAALRADTAAFVRVIEGAARVAAESPLDLMLLGPREEAVTIGAAHGTTGRRLARSVVWGESVVPFLARPFAPCEAVESAGGDVLIAVRGGGDGVMSIRIPSRDRTEAFSLMNLVQLDRVFAAQIELDVRAGIGSQPRREYEHEKDGRRTLVAVETDGSATLTIDGRDAAEFPHLAALRAARPDVAALFGDALR